MARLGTWALGGAVSVVAHLGFGAALLAALVPQEVPDQPRAKSTLQVTPESVTRSEATQQAPQSADIPEADAAGAALGAGEVAQSTARAQSLPQPKIPAQAAPQAAINSTVNAAAAPAQSAPTEASQALTPEVAPQSSSVLQSARMSAAAPRATSAPASQLAAAPSQAVAPAPVPQSSNIPKPASAIAVAPPTATAPESQLPTDPTENPAPLIALAALPVPPEPQSAGPTLPSAEGADQMDLPANTAAELEPQVAALPSAAPAVTATKAVLAFPNAGTGSIDPASLAAFQSFTQPQTGDAVRDNLQSALSLPCARMQVSFDPETTTLQVSGHVPQDNQRAPVLAALQAQMGSDITVTDNLLVLPAPQCGALSGIAAVGLPQSTDQITNPLIVGNDTHARSFRYIQGDPLVLDLTGPDYPAYVYVDYFDADGNVIHLSPNAQTPLRVTTPKQQLQIGARSADEDGLYVIIGPPYGQEIAVAFAASAPLYAEERPIVEPADVYLNWLQQKVADMRATTPDFKGEWVYFFVQTAEQ